MDSRAFKRLHFLGFIVFYCLMLLCQTTEAIEKTLNDWLAEAGIHYAAQIEAQTKYNALKNHIKDNISATLQKELDHWKSLVARHKNLGDICIEKTRQLNKSEENNLNFNFDKVVYGPAIHWQGDNPKSTPKSEGDHDNGKTSLLRSVDNRTRYFLCDPLDQIKHNESDLQPYSVYNLISKKVNGKYIPLTSKPKDNEPLYCVSSFTDENRKLMGEITQTFEDQSETDPHSTHVFGFMMGKTGDRAKLTYIPVRLGDKFPLVWIPIRNCQGAYCIEKDHTKHVLDSYIKCACEEEGLKDYINVFVNSGVKEPEKLTFKYDYDYENHKPKATRIEPHLLSYHEMKKYTQALGQNVSKAWGITRAIGGQVLDTVGTTLNLLYQSYAGSEEEKHDKE